jgi:hypothetical protein
LHLTLATGLPKLLLVALQTSDGFLMQQQQKAESREEAFNMIYNFSAAVIFMHFMFFHFETFYLFPRPISGQLAAG